MFEDVKMWVGGTLLAAVILPWVVKSTVAWWRKRVSRLLDKSLALEKVKDPVLRSKLENVTLAVVDVVEYITPDAGTGKEKFAKADALLSKVPMLAALPEIRAQLIEWACKMMWAADDEMKKRLPGIDGEAP